MNPLHFSYNEANILLKCSLAVCPGFLHSPCSVNGSQSGPNQAIHGSSPSTTLPQDHRRVRCVWLLSSNINNLSPESMATPLTVREAATLKCVLGSVVVGRAHLALRVLWTVVVAAVVVQDHLSVLVIHSCRGDQFPAAAILREVIPGEEEVEAGVKGYSTHTPHKTNTHTHTHTHIYVCIVYTGG